MSTSVIRWIGLIGAVCMWADTATAQSRTFDIYWVDVEGGAATLVVSPTGESLLVDTGFPGADDRDAKRIFAAVCSSLLGPHPAISRATNIAVSSFPHAVILGSTAGGGQGGGELLLEVSQ